MPDQRAIERAQAAVQQLAKWRVLFTGWQLGTRPKGDPEGDAVRDHREITILLRAELSALTGLLIEKGVFAAEEYTVAVGREAELLDADYRRRFPGVEATEHGLSFDLGNGMPEWMKGWKP